MTQLNDLLQRVAGAESGNPHEPEGRRGMLRSPFVQNVLPFVSSLTVHAAILVLGFVAVRVMIRAVTPATRLLEQQTVVPISELGQTPGGIPNPGESSDWRKMAQDLSAADAVPDGLASKRGPSIELTAAGPSGDGGDPSPSLVLGASSLGSKGRAVGASGGSGSNGAGEDGLPALFGAGPGGGAIGPHGLVFGNGGTCRRIVFVCDASGSMLNKMATLKDELAKAVHGLSPVQSFNIVFFHDESFVTLDANGLVAASEEAKRNAFKFLDNVVAAGTTDPIRGLELAFHQGPQLVYLLTDGDFPDNKAVLAKIRELCRGKNVKINTIAFVNESDSDTTFKVLLKQVADDSGGAYRLVNENNMGQ